MGFLNKVEAAISKPNKAVKHNQFRKSGKKINSPNAKEADAAGSQGEKVSFTDLTNTRKLIPLVEKALSGTDPFNFTNETWAKFIGAVIPKLIPALLMDMKIVPVKKRDAFIRYITKRMRALTTT